MTTKTGIKAPCPCCRATAPVVYCDGGRDRVLRGCAFCLARPDRFPTTRYGGPTRTPKGPRP